MISTTQNHANQSYSQNLATINFTIINNNNNNYLDTNRTKNHTVIINVNIQIMALQIKIIITNSSSVDNRLIIYIIN